MKLVTFSSHGFKRIGAIYPNKVVVDLNYAYQALLESEGKLRSEQIADAYVPATMEEFLQGGNESLSIAQKAADYAINNRDSFRHKLVHEIKNIKLEAPVQKPSKIICVGHNYREHIAEMGRELPPFPVVFAKFANTVIGPQMIYRFSQSLNNWIMKRNSLL